MRTCTMLCGLFLTSSLAAQIARDDWVISTINDFVQNTAIGAALGPSNPGTAGW